MKTVLFYIWMYAITFICLFLGVKNCRLAYQLTGANEKIDKLERKMVLEFQYVDESYGRLYETTKGELKEELQEDIYNKILEQIQAGMVCPVILRTNPVNRVDEQDVSR